MELLIRNELRSTISPDAVFCFGSFQLRTTGQVLHIVERHAVRQRTCRPRYPGQFWRYM